MSSIYTTVQSGSSVFIVTNTNNSGPGSLRQALLDSNATASTAAVPNKVVFDIPVGDPGRDPATGAFIIVPQTPLPYLDKTVILDGYTQRRLSPTRMGRACPTTPSR